jgi:hypothetical protein
MPSSSCLVCAVHAAAARFSHVCTHAGYCLYACPCRHAGLTEEEILWAIYSTSDNNSYLLFNRCEQQLLQPVLTLNFTS